MGTARAPGDVTFCLFMGTIGSLSNFLFFCFASIMAHSKRGLECALEDSGDTGSCPLKLGAVVDEYIST